MLAKRLKKLRKAHKITQEELARAIGVERSSIGKYESNVMPSTAVLLKIANYFNVSVDFILGGDDWKDEVISPPLDLVAKGDQEAIDKYISDEKAKRKRIKDKELLEQLSKQSGLDIKWIELATSWKDAGLSPKELAPIADTLIRAIKGGVDK